MRLVLALLAAAAAAVCAPARAVDAVSVEFGNSTSSLTDLEVARIAAQWNWQGRWLSVGNWYLGGYWEVTAGHWRSTAAPAIRASGSVLELGVTPVVRWQQAERSALSPYAELGFGLRLVSEESLTSLRDLGSPLLFGSLIGAGLRFGVRRAYEFGYRFQHLSTGGLTRENNGVNLQSIRLQYHF